MPVRSAFLGAVFGVLGVTVVLVFTSSLNHLVRNPSTLRLRPGTSSSPMPTPAAAAVGTTTASREHRESRPSPQCVTGNMQLDGRPVTGWGFTSVRGTIEPEVVAGHAPAGPRQVALGSQTLDALGKTIGDTVQAHGANTTLTYRIVGRVVFPTLGIGPAGDGRRRRVHRPGYSPALRSEQLQPLFLGSLRARRRPRRGRPENRGHPAVRRRAVRQQPARPALRTHRSS